MLVVEGAKKWNDKLKENNKGMRKVLNTKIVQERNAKKMVVDLPNQCN